MSNKQAIYESIVSEVREYSPFGDEPADYTDAVKGTLTLTEGISLENKTTAFSDIAVRDALLIDAMKDEVFAFVLINKIINTTHEADESKTFNQHDLEALALASHIATMWEQATIGVRLAFGVIPTMVKDYDLKEPSLNEMTRKVIDAKCEHDDLPIEKMRVEMITALETDIKEGLTNE
jgi:hypothetical protein